MPGTRIKKWLLFAALVLLAITVYSVLGVLHALSLYQGERALLNLKLWGSLALLCFAATTACIFFAVRSAKGSAPPPK